VRDTIIVTGGDRRYFLMICTLMQSLQASGRDALVLDFGLGEPERAFLRSKNALLDMPAKAAGQSPFLLKTTLGDYLAAVSEYWSAGVWFDADMIVDGNISGPLADLLDAMIAAAATVAACPDIAGTIRKVVSDQRHNFAPFVRALALKGIGLDEPYYNSGFIVFRSGTLLSEWYELASRTERHSSFDQNLFNIVAWESGAMMSLEPNRWNLHGEHLAGAKRDGEPRIFHPTSYAEKYHCVIRCGFDANAPYLFKFFRDPELARFQFQTLSTFLGGEQRALRDAGVILGPDTRLNWEIPRNAPCPCASGRRYKHCHGQLTPVSP
jgi:SEC-C motif